jgi:hypothetical protein
MTSNLSFSLRAGLRFFISLFFSTRPNEFFQIQAYLITDFDCWLCYFHYSAQVIVGKPSSSAVIRPQERNRSRVRIFARTQGAAITWDEKELDKFLQNPSADVHSTKMVVSVPGNDDRQNVIAYLKTLKP